MAADGKSEQTIFHPECVATPIHQQSGSAPAIIKLAVVASSNGASVPV
jgi:hypothetical protein